MNQKLVQDFCGMWGHESRTVVRTFSCRTPVQNDVMFYVMYLGCVCLATLSGLVLFLVIFITAVQSCSPDGATPAVIFITVVGRRHQQDHHTIGDHVLSLLAVHCLLGAAWVLGTTSLRLS